MTNQPAGCHVENMRQQLRRLRTMVALLTTGFLLTTAWLCANALVLQAQPADRIIRTRGIVIEDESGRERILIGAPIPPAANRVRTNLERVKQLWAPRYPNLDYMGFYKDYRHSTNGILILDENGFDRLALGDPLPDPNIGKRIAPSTGFVINDERGFERSGYGLLKVKDKNRIILGLDSASGREGVVLGLYDDGPRGLTISDPRNSIYVGNDPAFGQIPGAPGPFRGLLIKGADGARFVQNTMPAK